MRSLREVALFSDLDEPDAATLAGRCKWRRFEASATVFDFDSDTRDVHFVLKGEVRVLLRLADGKEVIFGDLGRDSYFGEISAVDGMGHVASVVTLQASEFCIMPAEVFRDALSRHPHAALAVMQRLAGNIRTAFLRLSEHTALTSRQRLCAELIRQSRPRTNAPDQRIISPPPNHRMLADSIGTQREVITRELSRLKRDGIVETARGGIVLTNPAALHDIVSAR